jgi:hypothetical protein
MGTSLLRFFTGTPAHNLMHDDWTWVTAMKALDGVGVDIEVGMNLDQGTVAAHPHKAPT